MNKGLTLPNYQYKSYTAQELDALDDLQPDVLVWLLYGGAIDLHHKDQIWSYLGNNPHTILQFRPYVGNIPQWDAKAWVKECYQRVSALKMYGEVICDNERNLAIEHGSESWQAHTIWLVQYAQEWRHLSALPIQLGALSPSGNYRVGYKYYKDHGIFQLFNRAGFHIYNQTQLEVATEIAATCDIPTTISEFNRLTPHQLFVEYLPSTVFQDATWFILGGTEDQAPYDILKQRDMYDSFKMYKSSRVSPLGVPLPVTYDIGSGVQSLMKQNRDFPIDNERYLQDQNNTTFGSETWGNKGLYKWNKRSGRVVFIPYGVVP